MNSKEEFVGRMVSWSGEKDRVYIINDDGSEGCKGWD